MKGRGLSAYALLVYLFLYAPIGLIVLISFNAGRQASSFTGFSLQWYRTAFGNRLMVEALGNSLSIALTSACMAAVMGTMTALALQRVTGWRRVLYDGLIYVALMVPGIVIGIATLIAIATVRDAVNPLLQAVWLDAPRFDLGWGSIVAAHTLFNMALVVVIVRARLAGMDASLMEAAADLNATPWGTFRQVTLPLIAPAILAGFLLAFTFSFDDYVVASFVNGREVTLPLYVFASIRRGVTPEINAIATVVLAVTVALLVLAQLVLRRAQRPRLRAQVPGPGG
ncbi:MAG: ABC transporter permease [Alphaproteobacteria bacterium]|nr:ABC transporter permease [Alphaproteobacteria bacterium]